MVDLFDIILLFSFYNYFLFHYLYFLLNDFIKSGIKLFSLLNVISNEFAFNLFIVNDLDKFLLKYSLIDPIFFLFGFIFILFADDISK